MPLPLNMSSFEGILIPQLVNVNNHENTAQTNSDFDKLDLSDFLDIIKVLTRRRITKNRRRIKKKRY